MVNNWEMYNKFLNDKINSYFSKANTLFVKVVETDGFYVSIMPFTQEEGFEKMENIPILQSKYFSPIVQAGDCGLLLDIKLDLTPFFENNLSANITRHSYYMFLPFTILEEFASNPDTLELKSADLETSLSLTNADISLKSTGEVKINTENLTAEAQGNISLNSQGDTSLECGNLSITSQGDLTIEGGSSPISVGNGAGTLGAVVDDLVSLMDMLASGMKGPSTEPSAYMGGKSAIVAKIKQVLA